MASFNLGRIKGERGERGERGDKGERGDRGERGPAGESGLTPTFTVGETQTLLSSQPARVEIDASDAANPILNFFIPQGRDGRGSGDMVSSVYDTHEKMTDVYDYADTVAASCLPKSGGSLSGTVVSAPAAGSERCIRNISSGNAFPEAPRVGELFFLNKTTAEKQLGDCAVGSLVALNECGKDMPYMVVAKNYHKEGTVTLVRKYVFAMPSAFNLSGGEIYAQSFIDLYLNSIVMGFYDKKIAESLISVPIETAILRKVFLLSYEELRGMEYFSEDSLRTTGISEGLSAEAYWTRSSNNGVYTVNSSGSFVLTSPNLNRYVRPAITLPSDFGVKTVQKNKENIEIPAFDEKGIFIFENGEWRILSCGND